MTLVTGLLMALAIAGAVMAVGLKNVLHAIFGFAISLLGIAGLFFVLEAPFIGAMEIVIYVGGITVAMIFAVMLSTVVSDVHHASRLKKTVGAVVSLLFFAGVAVVVDATDFGPPAAHDADAAGVPAIGRALLDHYNVVFEALSIILLMAIVGAIVIARRPEPEPASAAGGDA